MFGDRIPSGLRLGSVGASDTVVNGRLKRSISTTTVTRNTQAQSFSNKYQYILKFGVRERSTKYAVKSS